MPRVGEGRSIRIDPDVYDAILCLKHGNMTFSDVIADLISFFIQNENLHNIKDFVITKEEIESLWQTFEIQGGSKYRKAEGQKILDRVVARKDFAEKTSLERQGVEFL